MAQRCPVCKTPLWNHEILSRRLKCPRCGAEFRPAVSWSQFRIVVLTVMLVAFALIFFFAGADAWTIGILLIALILFFWYLPTFMELIEVPTNLTVAEGPMNERQLPLDYRWQGGEEDFRLEDNPGHLLLLVVVCAGLLLLMALLYSVLS